MEDKVTQLETS